MLTLLALISLFLGEISFVKPYQGGPQTAQVQDDNEDEAESDEDDDSTEGDDYSDADYSGVDTPDEEAEEFDDSAPHFHDDTDDHMTH